MPRRGYKTTEFWVTIAFAVGTVAAALTDQLTPRYAAIAASVAVAAFALSRGLAKRP